MGSGSLDHVLAPYASGIAARNLLHQGGPPGERGRMREPPECRSRGVELPASPPTAPAVRAAWVDDHMTQLRSKVGLSPQQPTIGEDRPSDPGAESYEHDVAKPQR